MEIFRVVNPKTLRSWKHNFLKRYFERTTKYNIVVAALDENVLDFVVDILSNPPHVDKYETLKNALLNRLTDTEESRLKKLLTDMELGDRRRSDLLRQMKSLAGSSISDELIKSLWLQRLPQQTQAILSIRRFIK
ncbi:uncharacterized protein TNIN_160401 [Trichonephila inaurata madagascariensis]|uniref:DUF7041 domain-containing protein n=1 Tax=Trichonephila inaurata madagascariensis TaxID=2747483 RepID=A0A8X6Y4E3_9ARAC|nr:uncharacterized protein TNIN_160401 [Trichonephila inaurata madagascariensis]